MAAAKKDTVQLTHPNGVTVRVAKDKADDMARRGFSKPAAKASSSSKSSS